MKIFRILFFLLAFSPLRAQSPGQTDCAPPLSSLDGSRLFKAGIDLLGRHYSGLFLFKAMPDSSVRIVFLSELGLNLLDMAYRQDEFRVVSVKDFLDRKSLIGAMQEDFRTLLLDPDGVSVQGQSRQYRHKRQRYRLECLPGGGMQLRRKKGLCGRTDYTIFRNDGLEIHIRHRSMRLTLSLTEILKDKG